MDVHLSTSDQDEVIEFLRDLIHIPSVSTDEGRVADRITQEMRHVGFAEVYTDRIGNVVGHVGGGRGAKLLYDGHMDTVGVGNPSSWTRDPFGAEVNDGILYGRGAADMKSGIASMIYGAKALLESGIDLVGDLYVVGVVQEEPCEGMAIRVLLEEENIRPDFVVLGEPTDLQLARGHRGRIELRVTASGRPCHAASPELGENAIYAASRIIVGIELLAPQLNHDSFLGKGSLAVTSIDSTAGSRNAVPDACTLYVDRRLTGGETEAKALAEIRRIIARENVDARVELSEYRATSYTGYVCRAKSAFPYWALPENAPLVQRAARVVERTLGARPEIGKWQFSTDGVYTAGVAGIPTVGFGPGGEANAHTADEQVRLDSVLAATRVYAQLAADLIGEE